jgi:hypothetical protein
MFVSISSHVLDNSVCEIPKLCRIQAVLLSLLKLSNESNLMLLITVPLFCRVLSPRPLYTCTRSVTHACLS